QIKIDDILQQDFRIIMTEITDLQDLYNNSVENYKRINVKLSLSNEDYEVFEFIISKDNSKLEEFYVNFELFDFNRFFAMIKKPKKPSINRMLCFMDYYW